MPRHQTLRATLDWSYLLLTAAEQDALAALSVCRGRFTMETAEALVAENADDLLAALVAKSLVVVETGQTDQFYRMLDTTRIYAAEKLLEAGRFDGTMARSRTLPAAVSRGIVINHLHA